MGKVNVGSRAEFGELAMDLVMPLIEAGEMVNLNGKLVLTEHVAKHLEKAA